MVFLTAALVAVWLVVMLYVVYMSRKQRNLEQELEVIEEMLADSGRGASGS